MSKKSYPDIDDLIAKIGCFIIAFIAIAIGVILSLAAIGYLIVNILSEGLLL